MTKMAVVVAFVHIASCFRLEADSSTLVEMPILKAENSGIIGKLDSSDREQNFVETNVIRVDQLLQNSLNSKIEIISVAGNCSCFLMAKHEGVVGAGEQTEMSVFLNRDKFRTDEFAEMSYVIQGRLHEDPPREFVQRFDIRVKISDGDVLFLPPKQSVAAAGTIRKSILVPASYKDVKFDLEGLDDRYVASSSIEREDTLLYDGKWRRVAQVSVSIASDAKLGKDGAPHRIALRCTLTSNRGRRSVESLIDVR